MGKKASLYGLTDKLACLIPSEDLRELRELGEGQYGVVHLGEWKPPQGNELVCLTCQHAQFSKDQSQIVASMPSLSLGTNCSLTHTK